MPNPPSKLRKQQNLSRGAFAREVHVSGRMVRMYEEGMNARVDVAYRIETLFEVSIIEPIDIIHGLQKKPKTTPQESDQQSVPLHGHPLTKEIFALLNQLGCTIIPLGRCPFEAVSKEKEKILLTCVQRYDPKLKEKAKVVTNISKITEKRAVFFTDKKGRKNHIEGTPLIIKSELKKIKDPEDIIELIIQRRSTET